MARFQLLLLLLIGATAMLSGAARADVYGYVENGRTRLLFTNTPPFDARYKLYKRDSLGSSGPQPPQRVASCCSKYASFTRSPYNSHVMAASRETQVDPALIHAVISVESAYNPSARSHAGAVGLMQLMPETARRYGVTDRLDPAQNIKGGARYLRDLKAMFQDNLQLVIAAYNAGEEAVMKYGRKIPPYRETQAYVPKVMYHYKRYGGLVQVATSPGV